MRLKRTVEVNRERGLKGLGVMIFEQCLQEDKNKNEDLHKA